MDYQWMPWNVEGSCSMPSNANLSSQVVDYRCERCGKFGHDWSSCTGKRITFGELLATNYDEIYHRNEHHLGYDHSLPIKCQRCGINGHDRNSCTKKKKFGELFESSQNHFIPRHLDFASQGYAQEPQPFHLDPLHAHPYQYPLSQSNGFKCSSSLEWRSYDSGFDTPIGSSLPLSPFEQLMDKIDECGRKWDEQIRKLDDRLERLGKPYDSLEEKLEISSTLSTYYEENEEKIESKGLCELEELSNENLLLKSDSSSTFPTLTPSPCLEEELIVDDASSTSCGTDEEYELNDLVNELESWSLEDLTKLFCSTNAIFIPQLSQEGKNEQPLIDLVEEAPHEVVIPIQLDENDVLIFNELVHQVEYCYINEITNEWEPSKIESGMGSKVEYETNEWYKIEFLENTTTLSVCDKFYPSPSLIFYKRFLTCEEISFFWYRDGYSECL